ncbi:hypothetical protein NLG97_g498 [Lecanicillium saksenae]|uniref:Uncharacterized protein n=1 Tax=Lecanicillium saksenae TaxID=468837 RepID=A0ACC1R709_9HYPO|nr:hypothetical protein NLG97_g498 [Lecanicillium saksenae]
MANFLADVCEAMAETRPDYKPSELQADISAAIYGSNMIESAGTSYDLTVNICYSIFHGNQVEAQVDESAQDADYMAHVEFLANHDRKATETAVAASRRDVINHCHAFKYMIGEVILRDKPISEEIICEAHRILARGFTDHGDDFVAGEYRRYEVGVKYGKGKAHMCMRWSAIQQRMAQLCRDVPSDATATGAERDAFALAARCHHNFVYIHPFGDGNGRVTRILMNVLLLKYAGRICTIGLSKEDVDEYLGIVTRGCKRLHEEDYEVAREEQTSYVELAAYLSMKSVR